MASPQKENGFTPIAQEILQELVKMPLNGSQFRIILVILRYTYGFNRKEHAMSESFISKATGISKRYISSELNKLIAMNILKVSKESTYTTPRVLAFCKDYEKWERGTILLQLSNNSIGECNDNTTVEVQCNTTVEQSFNQEINNIKKDLKKDIYSPDELEILEFWNTHEIIKHDHTAEMQKAIKNGIKKYKKSNIIISITNYSIIFHDKSYFYNHIWTLKKFLVQANGVPEFLEDGQSWLNYKNRSGGVVHDDSTNDVGKYGNHQEYARILDGN